MEYDSEASILGHSAVLGKNQKAHRAAAPWRFRVRVRSRSWAIATDLCVELWAWKDASLGALELRNREASLQYFS